MPDDHAVGDEVMWGEPAGAPPRVLHSMGAGADAAMQTPSHTTSSKMVIELLDNQIAGERLTVG